MVMKRTITNSKELASIVESQQGVIDDLLKIFPANHNLLNSLKTDLASISLEPLRILVYGRVACGKSQLINAIHGYKLNPSRHSSIFPPRVAEYKSGTDDKAILYPGPQLRHDGTSTFQIQLEEIKTYLSRYNGNDSIKDESPYDKFELYSSRCKEGLNLIDVTLKLGDTSELFSLIESGHLSKIDSVIYCMDSRAAYSVTDRDNIDILHCLGYTSIVFVLTYFDVLQENDEMMGTNDAQTTKEHIIKTLAPLTKLGEGGIFFINSIGAIKGKLNKDQDLIERSGILQLDMHIDNLIVKKHYAIMSEIAVINDNLSLFLNNITKILWHNDSCNEQLSRLKELFYWAKQNADIINFNIQKELSDIAASASVGMSKHICCDLAPNIDYWVEETCPVSSISFIHLRKSMVEYLDAVIDHVRVRINSKIDLWYKQNIESRLENIILSQKYNISSYFNELRVVSDGLKCSIPQRDITENIINSWCELSKQIGISIASTPIDWVSKTQTSVAEKIPAILLGGATPLRIKNVLKKEITSTLKLNLIDASKKGLSKKTHSIILETFMPLQNHIKDELYLSIEYLDSLMNYLASYSFNLQKHYNQLLDTVLRNEQLAKRLRDIMPKTNINNVYRDVNKR